MTHRAAAVFLFLCTACGAVDRERSNTKTLYGESSIEFLSSSDLADHPMAASMGALAQVVTVAEEKFASPVCSAFLISPRHILSVAHCYRDGDQLAFDPTYRVRAEDKGSFEFQALGKTVRLFHNGLPEDDYFTNSWKQRPLLEMPAHIDRSHDFVIWELATPRAETFVDWSSPQEGSLDKLVLYAYPNGNPLARSSACKGVAMESTIQHDCDSLSGSSGGLVVNGRGEALALHSQGPRENLWADYSASGKFESVEKIGWNRAVRLDFIREHLRRDQPELALAIERAKPSLSKGP